MDAETKRLVDAYGDAVFNLSFNANDARAALDAHLETIERERDALKAQLAASEAGAAAMRSIIVVRDVNTGGWECMGCNRVAAFNGRDDLEHDDTCALSTDAGAPVLERLRLAEAVCDAVRKLKSAAPMDFAAIDGAWDELHEAIAAYDNQHPAATCRRGGGEE